MRKSGKKVWINYLCMAILSFIAIKVLSIALLFIIPEYKTQSQFIAIASPLVHTYDLFDLGVVDANNDNFFDIFSLNHSARQNFLISDRDGTYTERLSEANLDQDYQFPGLEDSSILPQFNTSGLYIYRHNFLLHLQSWKTNSPISGEFTLSLPVEIKSQENSLVDIKEESLPSGAVTTKVSFTLNQNGHLVIQDFPEIPHTFSLSSDLLLESVQIGMEKLQPQQHLFSLMWRDRHTMAWSDISGDGNKDVFIGRGGVRGKISQLPETLSDELFIQQEREFEENIDRFGIIKDGCPARKSAWVDYDGDDRLELYVSCGRSTKDSTVYGNKLYQKVGERFVDIAPRLGLDLPGAGYFHWLDVDGDRDLDLIAVEGKQVLLYVNQTGGFEPQSIAGFAGGSLKQLAVADFDGDGDLDGYGVVEGKENQVLLARDGKLEFQPASKFGLPAEGLTASWVDYDNDGRLELHVIPDGLYHQTSPTQFTATNILDFRRPIFSTWNARSIWFDADNDGDRDLLVAYQQTPSVLQPQPSLRERLENQIFKRDTSKIWQSAMYLNKGNQNHWLQVDLVGSSDNAEGIGALISVETNLGVQTQQVGASEDSLYSQGSYRSYFGVGNNTQVPKVTVQWVDGTQKELKEVAVDRILKIDK